MPDAAGASPARKRPRVDPLHGGPGAGVDRAAEGADGFMAAEAAELLADAGADLGADAAARALLAAVSAALAAAPAAPADAAPVAGLLADLRFAPPRGRPALAWRPPAAVAVVGSFAARGLGGPGRVVDVALVVPRACFDAKDYLNHRYHAKRALYLAHVAGVLRRELQAAGAAGAVEWGAFAGDPRRPALLVAPPAGGGLRLRLLPAPEAGAFAPARLGPGRNNLRAAARAAPGGAPPPTPHYNAGVLTDMLLVDHAAGLAAAAAAVPALPQAGVLLRAWAATHHAGAGADGLGGAFFNALLVHMVATGQASPAMGPMHLFRAALLALGSPKALSAGLFMPRGAGAAPAPGAEAPPDARAWARAFPVVFVDASGWLNLAAGVSAGAARGVRDAARRGAALLADGSPDGFDAALLARAPLPALFDLWAHVHVPDTSPSGAEALDGDEPAWRAVERVAAAVAKQALGKRATLVRVVGRLPAGAAGGGGCDPRRGAPGPERGHVLVAARLDAARALAAVDMGPAADDAPGVAAFRAFWGDRAQLRRFPDGSISWAVAWEGGAAERHLVAGAALAAALARHLPPGTRVRPLGGALDGALRRAGGGGPEADAAAARALAAAADRLGRQLRALPGLTLRVAAVTPAAPALRSAAAFPPAPHPLAGGPAAAGDARLPRCPEAVELLCQLEGSGRWPDQPEAAAKARAALGVQLARALRAAHGLDAAASETAVDVPADGFFFRLRLVTERDLAPRAAALPDADGAAAAAAPDAALRAWHHGAVSAAASASPAFEPTVRLAKRWVGARLLSPHFADEAVELLAAALFAPGGAAPPPASRAAGLLRFLRLLADHPWALAPVVADPAGEWGPAERAAAARAHAAARAAGRPAAAACIATPRDPAGAAWTSGGRPSAPVLHRAAVLAARSAAALEAALLGGAGPAAGDAPEADGDDLDARVAAAVFGGGAADEAEYDALIRLRRDALPFGDRELRLPAAPAAGNLQPKRKRRAPVAVVEAPPPDRLCRAVLKGVPPSVVAARGAAAVRRELLAGFAPVPAFVAALEARLGGAAVFCADYVGPGAVVGLKWRPAALAPAPLRAEEAHWRRPAGAPPPARKKRAAAGGEEAPPLLAELDVDAVVADVLALGAGLVQSVELL